jgi:hypothetical protein
MLEQIGLVCLGCCGGFFVGTTFGIIFMGRLIAVSRSMGYIEENQMDTQNNQDGVVEKAVQCRVLVNCPLDRSADRLVNDHNFVLLPRCHSHYEKTMTGTWSDIMTYAESLRGIEGIVNVNVSFGDGPMQGMPS